MTFTITRKKPAAPWWRWSRRDEHRAWRARDALAASGPSAQRRSRLAARARTSAPTAAFTLLELLVVVTLVALVASLLLPSLANATRCAKATRCSSQLHQVGLAVQMYWDDHEGRTFAYRGAMADGGTTYWFGWLADGAEGSRTFDPSRGALWSYLQSRSVSVCPAFPARSIPLKLKAASGALGYGYNLALSSSAPQAEIRPQTTLDPAGLAIFADAAQVNDFQAPASPEDPMLEEFFYVSASEATAHFRHQERAQLLFADLHADREAPVPGSIDLRLPKARVGRLRREILEVPRDLAP